MDNWDGGRASLETDSNKLRSLIGTVTSCDKDGGFINQTTYFPRSALYEGQASDSYFMINAVLFLIVMSIMMSYVKYDVGLLK